METRIGSSDEDAQDVINHPFFAGMDWDALVKRKVKSPYIPEIRTDGAEQVALDVETHHEATIEKQDQAEALSQEKLDLIEQNKHMFD